MLKNRIQKDQNEALKSGEKLKRLVLGMLATAIKNRELAKRAQLSKIVSDAAELERQSQLTDEETVTVIASEVKKRKESVEQFRAGGREELAQKEEEEINILSIYLPEQLSEEKVKDEIKSAISEINASGIKDMGKVIGLVMAKLKGRADGGLVSRLVREMIS